MAANDKRVTRICAGHTHYRQTMASVASMGCNLAKVGVAGSNPVVRSTRHTLVAPLSWSVGFASVMSQKHTAARLSKSQRAALQALVAVEREKTAARVAALTRDFDDIVESCAIAPPDDEHDPEGATIAFERAQVAALLTQAHRHLADLELATTRLGDGTYGVCERCGQSIASERLLARPTAQTCINCASVK